MWLWKYGTVILSILFTGLILLLLYLSGLNILGSITTFCYAVVIVSLVVWARN